MGYRCLKDITAYCAGTAKRQKEEGEATYMHGNRRQVMSPFPDIKCPADPVDRKSVV
jgi:hypothetical protein